MVYITGIDDLSNKNTIHAMKIRIQKIFDGKYAVGFCDNLPSCYVQSREEHDIVVRLRRAIELYRKNCELRNQSLPDEYERPILDKKIRFETISSAQLVKIFQRMHYHLEYSNHESILLINSNFPFNRVHIPRTEDLSPVIVAKIFGKQNTIWVNKRAQMSSTG